jgi:hypothetical protein
VSVQPRSISREAFNEQVRARSPPTDDDVSITWDGRRIDTIEKLIAFAAEIEQERRVEALLSDDERDARRAVREEQRLARAYHIT